MNTPMHRFKYTKLTKDQITKKLIMANPGPECVSEFSNVLAAYFSISMRKICVSAVSVISGEKRGWNST